MLAALLTLLPLGKWPGSQGNQDRILYDLFYGRYLVNATNSFAVEFGGCPGIPGSNTLRLRKSTLHNWGKVKYRPWRTLLMDGWRGCDPHSPNTTFGQLHSHRKSDMLSFHRETITSENIVALFDKYGVPERPDYVSIDLDSIDLWVLQAILRSRYRPRVFTIEYNSNYFTSEMLTFPNPETMHMFPWQATKVKHLGSVCYMGASFGAIQRVAQEHNYAIVNLTRGLDLFLVDRAYWTWPVPKVRELRDAGGGVQKCLNLPMTADMAVNLLDYDVYANGEAAAAAAAMPKQAHTELVCRARQSARRRLRKIASKSNKDVFRKIKLPLQCPCFWQLKNLPDIDCSTVSGTSR